MKPIALLLPSLVVFAACSTPAPETHTESAVAEPTPAVESAAQPAFIGHFADTLPCADCPGILTDLTVRADSSFTLKEHYLESGTAPMEQTGKWRMTNDMLVIGGTDGQAWNFRPTDGGLQLVDASGNAHTSELDYTLDKVAGQ
jgi:uncharacterized lipoprotein NlpE involved in copper resistance